MDHIEQSFRHLPDQFLISGHLSRVEVLRNLLGQSFTDAGNFRQAVLFSDGLDIFRKIGDRLGGLVIRPRLKDDLSFDLQERAHAFQNIGDVFIFHKKDQSGSKVRCSG